MQKNNSTNKAKSTNANKAKTSGGSRITKRKANKNTDRLANSKSSSGKRKQNTADSNDRFLYLIPVVIWMIFIFYMSGKTGQESSGQSGKISLFITNLLEKVRQDSPQEMQNLQDILELVIRKTAHMPLPGQVLCQSVNLLSDPETGYQHGFTDIRIDK